MKTDDRFWDCECEHDYIHSKAGAHCCACGATASEQPDSRVDEVFKMHLHMLMRAVAKIITEA